MPTEVPAPTAPPEPPAVETTTPTPVAERPPAAPAAPPVEEKATTTEDPQTVRVMSYLTEEEAHLLDELWLQFRRLPQRPSKSDIMRAALSLAGRDQEALIDVITSQQISTLTRQRSSKVGYRRGR